MDLKNTLDDALNILNVDLKKIKELASSEAPLDRTEATKLTEYIRVLITASKNEREVAKLNNLETISDEELEELTEKALRNLGAKNED